MYRNRKGLNRHMNPKVERGIFSKMKRRMSMETLLELTETIATMAMGAGFLLFVAACLASF